MPSELIKVLVNVLRLADDAAVNIAKFVGNSNEYGRIARLGDEFRRKRKNWFQRLLIPIAEGLGEATPFAQLLEDSNDLHARIVMVGERGHWISLVLKKVTGDKQINDTIQSNKLQSMNSIQAAKNLRRLVGDHSGLHPAHLRSGIV